MVILTTVFSAIAVLWLFFLIATFHFYAERKSALEILGHENAYKWTKRGSYDKIFRWKIDVEYNSIHYKNHFTTLSFLTSRGADRYLKKVTGDNESYIKKEQEELNKIKKLYQAQWDAEWSKTFVKHYNHWEQTLDKAFPGFNDTIIKEGCPDCTLKQMSLSMLIQHLNDTHKWTRERIADWLEESDYNILSAQKE